jgi:predicted HD superfamily hydrolase involved in NAD metabolism
MNISDFPYIIVDTSDEPLIQRIETFYHINNRENTLEHVNAVAKTNIRIAKQYGLDKEKCFFAALLHDVSAVMKPADMTVYAISHGIVLDASEKAYPFLLHQQISKLFTEALFGINDADILSAIECHSTLKGKPNKYDMSLFIADKLSWDQTGQPPFFHEVNEALSTSLEAACLQYITYIIDNNLILYPHKWFSEAKNYLELLG